MIDEARIEEMKKRRRDAKRAAKAYRLLLWKYMEHVNQCEGSDFTDVYTDVVFDLWETKVLKDIAKITKEEDVNG